MNFTTDRVIIDEAVNMGCKTIAEFALYLKLRSQLLHWEQKRYLHAHKIRDKRVI